MKYLVDEALCCGYGLCELDAPQVFKTDDDTGINVAAGKLVDVPKEHEALARAGAFSCPEAAIRIID